VGCPPTWLRPGDFFSRFRPDAFLQLLGTSAGNYLGAISCLIFFLFLLSIVTSSSFGRLVILPSMGRGNGRPTETGGLAGSAVCCAKLFFGLLFLRALPCFVFSVAKSPLLPLFLFRRCCFFRRGWDHLPGISAPCTGPASSGLRAKSKFYGRADGC